MGKPKFGYWNLRGLAQAIRLTLAYMEVDYEEVVYDDKDQDTWKKDKEGLGMEAPNLPYWVDDKEKLSEHKAIMKYLIRKFKPALLPSDISKMARAEMVEGIVGDIDRCLSMQVYMNTKESNDYFDTTAPEKLAVLSKMLGTKMFFLGDELSYVDFLAYEDFYRLKTYRTKFIEGYPNLLQFIDRFEQLPGIKEYIASPKYIKAPCYGPMAANRI